MNGDKKKDALTELVDIVSSQPSDQSSNNGTVSTPSGEKVELGFEAQMKEIGRKIMEIVKRRRTREKEVLEHIVKKNQKNYERKKTN